MSFCPSQALYPSRKEKDLLLGEAFFVSLIALGSSVVLLTC